MKDCVDSVTEIKILGFQCVGYKIDFYVLDLLGDRMNKRNESYCTDIGTVFSMLRNLCCLKYLACIFILNTCVHRWGVCIDVV
ncbi:hypothetical protein RhiirA5_145957 [Rhizophagus irregularis]|uniref:Uncharacterized protein n=1 Tax=Rhizophagus irregularis TaxID=588596 RepID=A0A2N0PTD9_9GLOM|nr:hypothetical protein RhiirA5_145957 [Rhizophagus irregularis]GET59314.1 hypothetical protein GLOIN_2v1486539 [Rhizophagus irregularis DAOM 181602=DAOM 197198]